MTEAAERILAQADEAEARFDVDALVAHLSAAVRELTAAGAHRRAAMASVRLGQTYGDALGNQTASRAWFVRAQRLLENEPPCIEQGWVAVAAMGCAVDDPSALLAAAELALDRARHFGDVNLETKALADAGLAHVQAGRVGRGMGLLDEAMALACGPADDESTAAKSVCSFFTACYQAADHARVRTWTDPLRRRGLLGVSGPGPLFLSSHCDSVQGALLIELGRWNEADAVLTRAIEAFETAISMPAWHPAIVLADLRVRQGRYGEAEQLLLGKDQAMEALVPAARAHLAAGDAALARALALRGLRVLGADVLRAVELRAVAAEAAIALGDLAGAEQVARELTETAAEVTIPTIVAEAALAHARVAVARRDPSAARVTLERALDGLDPTQAPFRRVLLLIELARVHQALGDRASATLEARAASALVGSLDIVLTSSDRASLDRLAATAVRPAADHARLGQSDKWWSVSHAATTVRLADAKGLRYLAVLIESPGVERHALDLVDRLEGLDADGLDRRALGSAGEILDARARAAYRARIEALRSVADEALEAGRLEAAEAAQTEIDALVAQLAQAFGLGGRAREAGNAAEKARLNVTRALRTAIAKITEALPEAGAALDRQVRTGLFCAFEPHSGEISWGVQSRVNEPPTV